MIALFFANTPFKFTCPENDIPPSIGEFSNPVTASSSPSTIEKHKIVKMQHKKILTFGYFVYYKDLFTHN